MAQEGHHGPKRSSGPSPDEGCAGLAQPPWVVVAIGSGGMASPTMPNYGVSREATVTEPSDVRVTIPGYRDLVRVGSGGFSMVYSAYQEAFDRTVAVKVLTVELVDENAQRRFQRECRASGRLSNHPSIVTVLDSGFTDDGRPFITTEFMTQGSLADRLDDRGPYAVAAALEIGVLMCGALAAVHAAGILHRDIKPQNILVSDYGEPGLADFGISAITVGPEASIGTSSITPLHVAPEVLEGQPTSAASDVYSLGSTLYMLLAGRAPFQQGNDDALLPLMRRVVMDPIPDIDRPDIPPEVMDLLRYSMAKQPFARYSTAVSFGEAIQATQKYLGYPVTALRKPGTGTGDYVLPPAPDGAAITDLAIPPSAAIVGDAGLVGSGSTENAAGAIGAIGAAGAVLPPGSVETSGPAPVVAPKGGSKKGLLVAVGAVVVVMLVAAALFAKSSSNANPKVAAGQDRARSGAANNRLTDPANSTESTDPNSTTESTTAGQPLDPAPGLRFDMDAITVEPLTPTPGGTLRTAIDSEPGSWNPATSRLYDGNQLVATAIFDPLAVLTATGPEPYPRRLASRVF